ncbi:MAG: SIS domain-containing protein [Spirochaetales bacterium]
MQDLQHQVSVFCDETSKAICEAASVFNLEYYRDALKLLAEAELHSHRLHITGIGKPHHIANYMASLFSSTGTACYFLDGTEATHGSAGQVKAGDVIIAISYYGNVPELIAAVKALKHNGAKIISVTGFPESEIAKMGDTHLKVHVDKEGDYLNKPPRISMLVTLFMLMNLSLILQAEKGIEDDDYIKWHPAGQLGKKGIL